MDALIGHFWDLGILVLWLNLAIGRFRMRTLIEKGDLTSREATRFCIAAAAVIAIAGIVFGVVTGLSGVPTPCELTLPLTDRRLFPSYAMTFVFGAALLFWVWKAGGDRRLAVVGPAFMRGDVKDKRYTPGQVRGWLTALIIVAWGGFLVMRVAMPAASPVPGCEERK